MELEYKKILIYFASCGLYNYESIGESYRIKFIDPIIKELEKSIEMFNTDLQKENDKLNNELEESYLLYKDTDNKSTKFF